MAEPQSMKFDINSIMPLLLLAAPFLEARNPGSGLGLAAGVQSFMQGQAVRRRQDSVALLDLFSGVDDENLETTKGALIDAGWDPKVVGAASQASRAFRPKKSPVEAQLEGLLKDPTLARAMAGAQLTGQPLHQLISPEEARGLQGRGINLFDIQQQVTRPAQQAVIPTQRPEEGGLGQFLQPQGQQLVETAPAQTREVVVPRGAKVEAIEPTLGDLGIPVPPWASRLTPSQAKAAGIDVDRLLPGRPQEPQRIVAVDNQGRIVSAFEVPPNTRVVQVTPPKPQAPKSVYSVGPGGMKKLGEVPAGSTVHFEPRPKVGGRGGGGVGGGVTSPTVGGDKARFFKGSRGGRYAFIPEFGEVPASQVGSKLTALAKTDKAVAVQRAKELGLASLASRLAKGQAAQSQYQKELDTVERQMRDVGAQIGIAPPGYDRDKLSQKLKALTVRRQFLLRKIGQSPTPAIGPAPVAPDPLGIRAP